MTFPKIDSDDLVLFGSLGAFALGAALVTIATSSNPVLSLGVALIVFGLPAALITFMAASAEEPK